MAMAPDFESERHYFCNPILIWTENYYDSCAAAVVIWIFCQLMVGRSWCTYAVISGNGGRGPCTDALQVFVGGIVDMPNECFHGDLLYSSAIHRFIVIFCS